MEVKTRTPVFFFSIIFIAIVKVYPDYFSPVKEMGEERKERRETQIRSDQG